MQHGLTDGIRPIYELANYYILGRILYFVPSYSPIHPGRVLTTFAAISMVIEALNGNGASYIANQSLSENKRNIGEALLKAALLMQIIVVVLFIALASYFQLKCRHNGVNSQKLNRVLTTLYTSTALITVRTINRIVEYQGLFSQKWKYRDSETRLQAGAQLLCYAF